LSTLSEYFILLSIINDNRIPKNTTKNSKKYFFINAYFDFVTAKDGNGIKATKYLITIDFKILHPKRYKKIYLVSSLEEKYFL
tara:strand:- start:1664 stop:1912 length:249 start_codon:yes stop_codon:yes gene_type:complete